MDATLNVAPVGFVSPPINSTKDIQTNINASMQGQLLGSTNTVLQESPILTPTEVVVMDTEADPAT